MQSGFFVLHSFVMIMKVHSYVTVNGIMSDTYQDMRKLESELAKRVADVYKTDVDDAWKRAIHDLEITPSPSPLAALDESEEESPFETWASRASQTGSSMQRAQVLLPQLRTQLPRSRSPIPEHRRLVNALNTDRLSEHPRKEDVALQDHDMRDPHPLAWHGDAVVKKLAQQIVQLRENLYAEPDQVQGVGPMWPNNVTFANFWDFQLVPSLVYQLQYPRTDRIRPLYVLERIFATFGTFLAIYVVTVNWIMPVSLRHHADLPIAFLRLAAPMMLCVRAALTQYLLIFYLVFECVCNGFAELTRFADREFYQDWWNSASMDEFARKWNRVRCPLTQPVHHFLLQHVYVTLIFNLGISKHAASLLTFFLSSVLHEVVMIIVSGKVRGYLFFAQMSQYPLILLAQTPFIKNNRSLGNLIFWVGLMIGFPLLNVAYLVY